MPFNPCAARAGGGLILLHHALERVLRLAREFLDGARRRKVTTLPPSVLVRECAELRRQLGQVLDVIDQADDDTEPYCTRCGQWAGTFLGMDGWHHFRGDPAPGGQRELYDAGHEAVIGWMVPPGRAISPARMAMLAAALDDAATFRTERAGRVGDARASRARLSAGRPLWAGTCRKGLRRGGVGRVLCAARPRPGGGCPPAGAARAIIPATHPRPACTGGRRSGTLERSYGEFMAIDFSTKQSKQRSL